MSKMNISDVDLNLLVVLDALLADPNVTRAARLLGRSQPSVSRDLAELRRHFGAPLFVRTRRGFVATPEAEALRDGVREILERVATLLAPVPRFEAVTSRRVFRIATAEYAQCLLFPRLLSRLAGVAPGVSLSIVPWFAGGLVEALEGGQVDMAIAPVVERAPHVRSAMLFSDTFVTIHRPAHPLARKKLTLDAFAAARHLQVAPDGRDGSVVDDALAKVGSKRHVVLRVPSFAVAPLLVASSDLLATVPARFAAMFGGTHSFATRETPLRLPSFKLCVLWHDRAHEDAGVRWLRRELALLVDGNGHAHNQGVRMHLERRVRDSL